MPSAPSDPYVTLGVNPEVSDAELRAAYRRAVQREHPDHNGGSAEAARRFEAVQDAYALIRVRRERTGVRQQRADAGQAGGEQAAREPASHGRPAGAGASSSNVESRLADLERELAGARAARERARRAAREAEAEARANRRAPADRPRPSDEDLGYIRTDDSFSKIISDAASELLSEAHEHRVPERLSDLIDELGSKLTGEPPER